MNPIRNQQYCTVTKKKFTGL